MSYLSAKVKTVLSGDSVVLVPPKTTQLPAPERILTLSYVRGDSFKSKQALRDLLIGKVVKFKVFSKAPTGREFGDIQAPIFSSLIEYAVEKGWVKVKEGVSASNDDEDELLDRLADSQARAQAASAGVWGAAWDTTETVPLTADVISSSQKALIPAVVEKVISGDRIVASLLLGSHIVSGPLILAGVKAPRTDGDAALVPVAHQAKQFVEDKLLTRQNIKVKIIGENQAGLPLVWVEHPSGNNLHEKLLENGFAEVVDWQSSLVGSANMVGLRKAEQSAKALAKGIYANATVPTKVAGAAGASSLKPGATVSATVARIVNADTLVVRLANDDEVTVQLASVRAPRPNDTTVTTSSGVQQAIVATAREFVRNQVIGKLGSVYVDGYRPANADLGLDARPLVSFKYGDTDLSEVLVRSGWATVIKHNKATASERALNWDRLVELEEQAKADAKRGVWIAGDITKALSVGTRIVDASENAAKAKTFYNGFRQKGRIAGYHVEYVAGVNRVKLFNPKEGLKLTVVLGGLSNEKSDVGTKYLNKRFLQRSVEFEIYDTDKIGGFVGNLYANAKALTPVQVALVEQGLTSLNEISVGRNQFHAELTAAEEAARSAKKGVWANYTPVDAATTQVAALDLTKPDFFDIEVTDIDPTGIISFHKLNESAVFADFKNKFNAFHSQPPSALASSDLPFNLTKPPKKGELVSARFAENNKYYRARVIGVDRVSKKIQVKHVDFGNVDTVALASLRALPAKFGLTQVGAFAHNSRLQSIQLPPSQPSDYLSEALYALEELTFDKKLVISGLPSLEPGIEYDAILYDSEQSLKDPSYTINKQLVADGWGIVQRAAGAHLKAYLDELAVAEASAKKSHAGCWEFGDVSFDEEPLA